MRKGRILFVCLLSGLMIVSISQSAVIKGKVTSVQGNAIEMDAGSEKGIKLGDLGRVCYVIQIEGKEKAIYVAKFKIMRLTEKSSVGQVEEKTTDLRPGYLVEISSVVEGELEIRSEPLGARVSVDGKEAGKTPLMVSRIKPGQHQIRVLHEGYEPYEERVRVSEGERKQIFVSLKKGTSNLVVRSEPPGASISIDGKPVGVGLYEGKDLSPGRYKIRVVKEGYEPWEAEQKVEAGKSVEVVSKLNAIEGSLEISSEPSGARVYFDGVFVGDAPLTLFQIAYGPHLILVDREGCEAHEERVQVKDSQKARIVVALKKMVGELRVETDPTGAQIYVDGKSSGVSPYEGKDLSPGLIKVRATKEGYETWEKDVNVEPGKRLEVLANMKERKVEAPPTPPPPSALSPPPVAKPVLPKENEVKPEESPKIKKEVDLAKKGVEAPVWKVGDTWLYKNLPSGNFENWVVEVKKDVYILRTAAGGTLAYDKKTMNVVYGIGKDNKEEKHTEDPFRKFYDFPLSVGKKWNYMTQPGGAFGSPRPSLLIEGPRPSLLIEFQVEGVEEIVTQAGAFMTFRVHCQQTNLISHERGWLRYWYSPIAKREVKVEVEKSTYWARFQTTPRSRELIAYELKQ